MSVRSAKFGDYWRTVYTRRYPERISSIRLSDSKVIADSSVLLEPGIVALVGGNGVGKSTFAHAIAEGLFDASRTPDLAIQRDRILGSVVEFDVEKKGEERRRRVVFGSQSKQVEGDETLDCRWLDPSLFSMTCRQQVQGDDAFEDVLDGIAPQEFTAEQVELVSYIVGKTYSTARVWEISDYGPFDVWPYFEVTTKSTSYRSEAMGQGELALLSAVWAISRCSENSIVVLEEPETHVSSRSQMSFMDFLARESAKRGISFVLTTHSPVILQRIPLKNTFILVNDGDRSDIIPSPRFHHLSSLVGGGASYKSLVVVEDETAQIFCDAVLSAIDPDLSRQVIYAVSKHGESEIVRILETMPHVQGWIKLVGCFDGDQRTIRKDFNAPWPHIFLPGERAPDWILKDFVAKTDKGALATELRIDKADLQVAIATAEGVDHHDWVRHLGDALNLRANHLTRDLTIMWVNENQAAALQFADALKRSLG